MWHLARLLEFLCDGSLANRWRDRCHRGYYSVSREIHYIEIFHCRAFTSPTGISCHCIPFLIAQCRKRDINSGECPPFLYHPIVLAADRSACSETASTNCDTNYNYNQGCGT